MGVVLLGYRGSGKTTVGRKLADRFWQKFVDTDDLVVASAGKSIREIFEQDGEDHFRELEIRAVREAVGRPDHVIALGGGAVTREENRSLLKSLELSRIYMKCEPAVLVQRIQADANTAANRPDLTNLGGGIEEVTKLLSIREPLYREVMTKELEVTNLSIDEAVVYLAKLV
jgi:shikimate kinase